MSWQGDCHLQRVRRRLQLQAHQFTIHILDFWCLEQGKIRENWVLVDLVDMYHQQSKSTSKFLSTCANLAKRNIGVIDW